MIGENPSFKSQDIAQREFAKEKGGTRITTVCTVYSSYCKIILSKESKSSEDFLLDMPCAMQSRGWLVGKYYKP